MERVVRSFLRCFVLCSASLLFVGCGNQPTKATSPVSTITAQQIMDLSDIKGYQSLAEKCKLQMLYKETLVEGKKAFKQKPTVWAWMIWANAYALYPDPAPGFAVEGGRPGADFDAISKAFDEKAWASEPEAFYVLSCVRAVDGVKQASCLVEELRWTKYRTGPDKPYQWSQSRYVKFVPSPEFRKYVREPALRAVKLAPDNVRYQFRVTKLDPEPKVGYKKLQAWCAKNPTSVDYRVCLEMYACSKAAGKAKDAEAWKTSFVSQAKLIENTPWRKYIAGKLGF